MTAFIRITLLRWLRRPLGAGLIVSPLLLSVLFCFAPLVLQAEEGPKTARIHQFILTSHMAIVFALGPINVSNQLAAMVHEEKARGRLPLLRVGGLDGWRAIACYSVVGLVLCATFGTLGHATGMLGGLLFHLSLTAWAVPVLHSLVVILAAIPAGIFAGIVLPRVLALIVLSLAGFGWGLAVLTSLLNSPARWLTTVVICSLLSVLPLPYLWKRFALR